MSLTPKDDALAGEVESLLATLHAHAHPTRAVAMAAYMRGQFSFLGIASVERRALSADWMRRKRSPAQVIALADQLLAQTPRECSYIATDLLRRHAKQLRVEDLAQLLAFAQRGAWWDVVDALVPTIAQLVRQHRKDTPRVLQAMDESLQHPDRWLRRVAILHQLGWRLDTDFARLSRDALHLAPEREFFIRKAIGWALRDYARWAPDTVRAFLLTHGQQFSPLSLREAGKHLGPIAVPPLDATESERA